MWQFKFLSLSFFHYAEEQSTDVAMISLWTLLVILDKVITTMCANLLDKWLRMSVNIMGYLHIHALSFKVNVTHLDALNS